MSDGSEREGRGSVGLILAAMLAFALQDVAVKVVAGTVSIWQLQLVRSIAVLGLLAAMLWAVGRARELVPTRWRWPLLRAVILSGAYLFFYASLPFLSLSEAGAAFFVGPLLITVFAALLLGEPIGPRRIAAVGVGFLGVLLIVRPDGDGFSPVALMPLAAAACYALGMVMTRWRCRDQPGPALTFTHNLVYASIGALGLLVLSAAGLTPGAGLDPNWAFLLDGWRPMGTLGLTLMLATAVTHLIGMLASVAAYRGAEASRIAPFEYSYLVMMPVLDLAIWGLWPAPGTLLGMALIIAAGSFVAWREGRPARPRVQFRGEIPWTPDAPADKEGR